mmetsp:Transcript_14424/g.29960  ORF Transcript_14424/g.29960 Transcript_14424/m.29960 type:complete len:102 (+) Transcript_14424:764-1069(+)
MRSGSGCYSTVQCRRLSEADQPLPHLWALALAVARSTCELLALCGAAETSQRTKRSAWMTALWLKVLMLVKGCFCVDSYLELTLGNVYKQACKLQAQTTTR